MIEERFSDNVASNTTDQNTAKKDAAVPAPSAKPESSTSDQGEKQQGLAPDEQMALYEKELKENDWGHQPC